MESKLKTSTDQSQQEGDSDINEDPQNISHDSKDEISTITSEMDYSEEELKKAEEFKEKGNKLF